MTYMVKVIATATAENKIRAGEVHTYYIGKGGWVHDYPWINDGWKSRRWADAYIRDDRDWHDHYENDPRHPHPHLWDYEYEVLTIVS